MNFCSDTLPCINKVWREGLFSPKNIYGPIGSTPGIYFAGETYLNVSTPDECDIFNGATVALYSGNLIDDDGG